jgi:hypothetical protein
VIDGYLTDLVLGSATSLAGFEVATEGSISASFAHRKLICENNSCAVYYDVVDFTREQ